MDSTLVLDWSREAIRLALVLGAPALVAALAVGILVGIGQTLTQMQEPIVGVAARWAAVLVVTLMMLPWLASVWIDYATSLIGSLPDRL